MPLCRGDPIPESLMGAVEDVRESLPPLFIRRVFPRRWHSIIPRELLFANLGVEITEVDLSSSPTAHFAGRRRPVPLPRSSLKRGWANADQKPEMRPSQSATCVLSTASRLSSRASPRPPSSRPSLPSSPPPLTSPPTDPPQKRSSNRMRGSSAVSGTRPPSASSDTSPRETPRPTCPARSPTA